MQSIRIEKVGEYLTMDAASKQLDVPVSTLEYILKRDRVQAYLLGHTRLLKQADVDTLLTTRRGVK